VVGDKLAHLRAGVWTIGEVPTANAQGTGITGFATDVWANSPNEVFVGATQSTAQVVWRGDGSNDVTAWIALATGTRGSAIDLFGAREGDLWSTGPYIGFHWDGYQVSYTEALVDNWDARYWGIAPDNMWASTNGSLLHRRRD